MAKPPVRLRPATQEDVPFIFNAWLKSYRTSSFARDITKTIFFNEHHKVIEKLLKTNQTIIACSDSDPTQIYGFICAGRVDGIFALHYIYVKHTYRNLGLGKALLNAFDHEPGLAAIHTHMTRSAERLAPKYNMLYHPYVLMLSEQELVNHSEEANPLKSGKTEEIEVVKEPELANPAKSQAEE